MAKGESTNGHGADKAPKRSRWATRKLTVKSSGLKRISIIDRIHKRTGSNEKKRHSGGSNSLRQGGGEDDLEQEAQDDANSDVSIEDSEGRTLFFNLPLPAEFKDEEGHPRQQFTRNKIRTAKYTPLSFVPKNLWFQFHNIANIFFLFQVILVVCVIDPLVRLAAL
jgi:phospholipid-translocating ATPase